MLEGGGGAMLRDAVVNADGVLGERGKDAVLDAANGVMTVVLLLLPRREFRPVWEGVREGVPLGIGVDEEVGARSSQAMTSKALPPGGISLAT